MRGNLICEICGEEYLPHEDTVVEGTHICPTCVETETVICRRCGGRIWNSDAVDGDLCENCYDEYYTRCCDCNEVVHSDDVYYDDCDFEGERPYCEHCWNKLDDKVIHDYFYKPSPIFYGKGKRYYGVELEVDNGGEYDGNAETLLGIGNKTDSHIYIKHDGSLDNGFEIVSHPMTLNYHLGKMPWKDVMYNAVCMQYRSHKACTCGLHVHISRDGLGEGYDAQEATIAKILYFYEKFWNEILEFSRRSEEQANRWARRYGGGLINPKESLKHAKNHHMGRYMAVNLENPCTVEMRIFRGTLKYSTFAATLQFVDSICDAAVSLSDEQMQNMTWLDFVQRIPEDKKELIKYLKTRRLYVNEPVETAEEV